MLQYCGTTGTSRAGNVTHNRDLLDLLALLIPLKRIFIPPFLLQLLLLFLLRPICHLRNGRHWQVGMPTWHWLVGPSDQQRMRNPSMGVSVEHLCIGAFGKWQVSGKKGSHCAQIYRRVEEKKLSRWFNLCRKVPKKKSGCSPLKKERTRGGNRRESGRL